MQNLTPVSSNKEEIRILVEPKCPICKNHWRHCTCLDNE